MLKDKAKNILESERKRIQFVRYAVNGAFSAAVHYGVYLLLQMFIYALVAYCIGYLVSFLINYVTTCYFVFRREPSWKHFLGFGGSHCVNFTLHTVLFWVCLQILPWIGVSDTLVRYVSPVIVMGIAMIVQFSLLRIVFRKR